MRGRSVIATAEQVEEAYRRAAQQMGVIETGQVVVMWPKRQVIVWLPSDSDTRPQAGERRDGA